MGGWDRDEIMPILYNHARKIVDEDKPKVGLFLGTGSTKTRIALFLARRITFIIVPKTQFDDKNWQREYEKVRLEASSFFVNLKVFSKETFRRDWDILPPCDTLIIDEAHTVLGVTPNVRYVNKKAIPKTSQLFEALEGYVKKHNPERLYPCTATIIRSPMTVWGAAKLLGYDWDWYKFRSTFYVRLPMAGREVFTAKNDSATKDRLAKAVRKIGYTGQLSDYFDVPPQTYKTDYIELTEKQKKRIKELPLEYPDPLVLTNKRHQVENGVLAGDEFNRPEEFTNGKIEKLQDYALEFPKMIVFAKYTAQIEQISRAMNGLGKRVFILTGATKDRGKLIADANITANYVFIAQSQISAGWELPSCPVMIFASLDWSVVSRIQAEGRILRANKLKKNLYIDLVVKEGVDEAVYKSIKNKKEFNERIYLNL